MFNKPMLVAMLSAFPMFVHADHNETIELEDITVTAPTLDSRIIRYPATVETYNKQPNSRHGQCDHVDADTEVFT